MRFVEMKTLKELCTAFIVPQRDKPKEFGGSIPWCRIEDIDGKYLSGTKSGQYVTEETVKKMNLRVIPKGSVICSCSASLGVQAILTEDCVTNQTFIGIVPGEQINKDFLYYFLKSKTSYFKKIGTGTTIPYISRKKFEELCIPDSSLQRQDEIVSVLEKTEAVIERRNSELKCLDQLIKARFVEMFGAIKQEKLLGEIAEFVTVGIANSATHAYVSSGIPMLRNQNIKENHLDDSDILYIKPEFAAKYESKKLKENDIIAMRTGYPGVACLVPKKYEGCQTFTTLIVRLKPDNNPNYVCSYINSDLGKSFINSEKVGVAQQNLGAKSLAKMPIKIAPRGLQEEYAGFLKQIDKSKAAVQKALDEAQVLFDSLMQEYFG